MSNPTPAGVTFDPATLTAAEADGDACVVCGVYFAPANVPSVPVGMVDGAQVFACSPRCDRPAAAPVQELAAAIRDALTIPDHIPHGEQHAYVDGRRLRVVAALDALAAEPPDGVESLLPHVTGTIRVLTAEESGR